MSDKTELPTVEERCETCRYWDEMSDGRGGGDMDPMDNCDVPWGFCRRHPPVYRAGEDRNHEHSYIQPRTPRDTWCGEWRAKAAAPKTALPSQPEHDFVAFLATLPTRVRSALQRHGKKTGRQPIDSWSALFAADMDSMDRMGGYALISLIEAVAKSGQPVPAKWLLSHRLGSPRAREMAASVAAQHGTPPAKASE